MKNIKYTIVLSAVFAIFACEDNLDVSDPQSITIEEVKDSTSLTQLVVGNYSEAGEASGLGGELQLAADLLGNTDEVSWNGTFSQPREFFTKNMFADNTFVSDYWVNFYEVIYQSNLLLANSSIFQTQEARDLWEGHALFLRGLSYFELVRYFGLQYQAGQTNSQLGVPLVLSTDEDFIDNPGLDVMRNTVEEVYAQVIADLTEAYNKLPDTDVTGIGLGDKYAAAAILSRAYLQMQDYPNALTFANEVIENSGHTLALSFDGAFNINGPDEGTENVFSFKVTSQDGDNALILYYASQANGGRGGDVLIESGYEALFDSPSTDQRFSFRDPDVSFLTGKYLDQFANVPLVRIAEMYLVRAECNFREGTSIGNDPLVDINLVRARSGAPALTTLDLDIIFNERQLELAFEGFLVHDIRRFERNVGALSFDAPELVLPIPQREVDANPNLEQNPGY